MPVLTIPDGGWTCAVDEPSSVVSLTGVGVGGFPDVTQCAMQCTGDADCGGFNVKVDMRLCEMYRYSDPPTRLALIPGCQYRQVSLTPADVLRRPDVIRPRIRMTLQWHRLIHQVPSISCLKNSALQQDV